MASQTSPPSLLSRSRSSNGAHPHWGKAAAKRASGQTAGEIGTRLVGLLRRHTGRGPTKARASISSDLVLVTFSEGLTTAETHFAAAGLSQLVARARSVLYDLIRDDATAIVEELTGRKVVAYLTAQHDEPDIAILVFYLDARR